jgi:hypothetical protein
MTTEEYLYDTEETNRIRELAMGVVRECWLVDLPQGAVIVNDFSGAFPVERIYRNLGTIQSSVFPDLRLTAFGIFL